MSLDGIPFDGSPFAGGYLGDGSSALARDMRRLQTLQSGPQDAMTRSVERGLAERIDAYRYGETPAAPRRDESAQAGALALNLSMMTAEEGSARDRALFLSSADLMRDGTASRYGGYGGYGGYDASERAYDRPSYLDPSYEGSVYDGPIGGGPTGGGSTGGGPARDGSPYGAPGGRAERPAPQLPPPKLHTSRFEVNCDGSIKGMTNNKDFKQDAKQDSDRLFEADTDGGFMIGNAMTDHNGCKRNLSYAATVDGRQIQVTHNGDGKIQVTVDGKEVKPGETVGPVSFADGGPGGDGVVTITGKKTGPRGEDQGSVKATIQEDISFDQSGYDKAMALDFFLAGGVATMPFERDKHWNHNGLTLNVETTAGVGDQAPRLGGLVGDALNRNVA